MTISQITAAEATAPAFCFGGDGTPNFPRTWFINGVAYTTNAGIVAYCTGLPSSYQVATVGSIPSQYTTQVARLESWPGGIHQGGALTDGDDPNAIYQWPGRPGAGPAYVDVRNVIAGTA